MSQTRRLAAILAADVAGYSRLMGADEEGTLAAVRIEAPPDQAAERARAGDSPKPAAPAAAPEGEAVDQSLIGSPTDYQLARAVDLLRGIAMIGQKPRD
jgi:hypothetical protein